MAEQGCLKQSKYMKPDRERKVFRVISVFFLFSLFVMPQYFGIPTPVFDFTLLRIMIVLVTLMILADEQRKNDFANLILHSKLTLVLIPYLIVISYTMVLRTDLNAFLNPFIEIFSLYLIIYMIKYELGVEKTIQLIISFTYLLTILGLIEYVMGRSPFSYLETIKGIYTGQFVRSGNYRIMSSCTHSLGYGLLLTTVVPFASINLKENKINLLQRPLLFFLLMANVFLTGSRSSLGVFFGEAIVLFIMTNKTDKKKCLLEILSLVLILGGFLAVGYKTSIGQYILLQITSIIDSAIGTQFSVNFGADMSALSSSSNYREQLIYIFQVDWLNPFLGIGRSRSFSAEINGSYVRSVDDFYIAEYIRYAYPGLFAYVFFVLYYIIQIIKNMISSKNPVYSMILVGTIFYMINLKWVDSLQTLKYLYILIAIFICTDREKEGITNKALRGKKQSKYVKDRGLKWI